jgi:hypothetical protein
LFPIFGIKTGQSFLLSNIKSAKFAKKIMSEILKEASLITSIVLVIMLIIEYVNVGSHGHILQPLQHKRWVQYLVSVISCLIPGCVGPLLSVSLFIHRIIQVGALMAGLVISFGDEAFVLYALNPGAALQLTGCLIVIGLILGVLTQSLTKENWFIKPSQEHFTLHNNEHCHSHASGKKFTIPKWNEISFTRALLIMGHILILFFIFSGSLGHDHNAAETETHAEWFHLGWEQFGFLALTLFSLFIVSTVPDHFLEEHLWKHVLRKHFFKIMLWTLGTLILIHFLTSQLNFELWIKDNKMLLLLLAALVGLIPQSGPHLLFITLFAQGSIPFSILLTNSIVQDGHGALPLLAESKRSFFLIKGIKFIVALIIGFFALNQGW